MSAARLAIVGAIVAVAAAACVGAERSAPPASAPAGPRTPAFVLDSLDEGPPHKLLGCLTGDSAVYGDVREDPATGDTVGVWVTFYRAGASVDGMRVLGTLEHADTMLFTRVQLGGEDSIAFDVPTVDTPDTSRFLGRVGCDRLWGRQRERRDNPSRAVVYRRVIQQVQSEPVP